MSTTAIERPADGPATRMFEVTLQLNRWALGDAQIVMTMPADAALESLLDASFQVEIVPVSEAG